MARDLTSKRRKRRPNELIQVVCTHCSKSFWTQGRNAKYCTTTCRDRFYYLKNRAAKIESSRRYREANCAQISRKQREFVKMNSSLVRERNRISYQKHRDRRIAEALEYQKKNPQVVALTRGRRRARSAFKISQADHRRALARYRNSCAYCGTALGDWGRAHKNSLQWDHVFPLSKGGNDSPGNLLPVCRRCNSGKSAKFLIYWKLQLKQDKALATSGAFFVPKSCHEG